MDSFLSGPLSFRIVDTPHGPEVAISAGYGGELARLTVGEFEALAVNATTLARTARARLSAKTRMNNLPMRS